MSYIVTHPFYGPAIYHHPSCPHIRRYSDQSRQILLLPEPGAVPCATCGGNEYVKREPLPTKRKKKPTGTYFVGRGGFLTPDHCPSCGGEAVEHDVGRMWLCWECDWYGEVNSKTWTKIERDAMRRGPRADHHPGRAVPRSTKLRTLAS